MPHKITITVEDLPERYLMTLLKSLKPEERLRLRGIKLSVDSVGNRLVVIIEAPEVSSLRVAFNSVMRLIGLVTDVINQLTY